MIKHHTRHPVADAKELFNGLADGARLVKTNDGGRITAVFPDGSRVVFRPISGSDGSPAVEVYNPTNDTRLPPRQKVHFMKETV